MLLRDLILTLPYLLTYTRTMSPYGDRTTVFISNGGYFQPPATERTDERARTRIRVFHGGKTELSLLLYSYVLVLNLDLSLALASLLFTILINHLFLRYLSRATR